VHWAETSEEAKNIVMRRAKIPIDAEIIEDLFVTTGVYLLDRSAARPMGTRASNEMCKTGNGGHSEPN
jgi:hypothetical protein